MARREVRPRRREFFPVWYGGGTTTPAPVITSPLTASGTVGVAFSYTITATNSPTSYNATGLPAGLTVNTGTGAITGTPSAAATTNVTISATNAGGSDSKTLVLTVSAATAALSGESAVYSDIFAWLKVTTDTASGTLYAVVVPAAATPPIGAQIEAGQDGSGAAATAAANQAISSSGAKTLHIRSFTGGTAYKVYATHKVAANYSNIVNVAFTSDVLVASGATNGASPGLGVGAGCAAYSGANLNRADPYGGTNACRFMDSNDSVSGGVLTSVSLTFFNGVNKVFCSVKYASGATWMRLNGSNVAVGVLSNTHLNISTGALGTNGGNWSVREVLDLGGGWLMYTGACDFAGVDVVGSLQLQKGLSDNSVSGILRDGTHQADIYNVRITRAGP